MMVAGKVDGKDIKFHAFSVIVQEWRERRFTILLTPVRSRALTNVHPLFSTNVGAIPFEHGFCTTLNQVFCDQSFRP